MANWLNEKKEVCDDEKVSLYCSECGSPALGYPFWECDIFPSQYCPHCGELMENGKEFTD